VVPIKVGTRLLRFDVRRMDRCISLLSIMVRLRRGVNKNCGLSAMC